MTYEDFKRLCEEPLNHRGQRAGQFAYNRLFGIRRELAELITGQPYLDPFYRDDNLPAFWGFLKERW